MITPSICVSILSILDRFLHTFETVSRPFFPPFPPVFCAFSPSGQDGSNEPQAGTQGQETADKGAKTRELPPSFDTPGANQRINWVGAVQIVVDVDGLDGGPGQELVEVTAPDGEGDGDIVL